MAIWRVSIAMTGPVEPPWPDVWIPKKRDHLAAQFENPPGGKPTTAPWIESFIKRLRELLDRIAGRK
jgi:hypothetical protein